MQATCRQRASRGAPAPDPPCGRIRQRNGTAGNPNRCALPARLCAITRRRDARGMPPPEPHPSRHQGHSSPYRSRPCRNATVRRLLHGIALRYENRTIRRSGRRFDWNILNAYSGETPFLLSGGIGPGDAERLQAVRHPQLAGVDVNSLFESEPGHKECGLLQPFIEQLKTL